MPFTPAQQSAIQAQNRELLVSAAAGSGKTAVLVERIFTLIQQHSYSIDRMLVVTFTHAAAAEMRERLETRLEEAATGNRAMQRQAELVESAQISTLHSLCQRIVREHFEAVDIDPQAAFCDERQREQLLAQAMGDALREAYELAPQQEDLLALTQKFSQREIETMLGSLYPFLLAQPQPFQWLEGFATHTYGEADLQAGPMAETLLHDCRILLEGAKAIWQDVLPLERSPFLRDKYAACLQQDGALLHSLDRAAQEGLSSLLEAAGQQAFTRMPSLRLTESAETEAKEAFQAARNRYKGLIEEMKSILPRDGAQSIRDLQAMQPALRGLAAVAKEMHRLFGEMKNERSLLDFSDLEHMALAILAQPTLRRKIAARYDAIFVDEYQDISGIQEAILNALKRPEEVKGALPPFTCFYVGDVKQSIYRFRQADPTLFMEKQRTFAREVDAPQRKITLNHNFRSREAVLDAVNRVFSHVMRQEITEIAYDEDARLHPGLPSVGDAAPQLHIVSSKGVRAAQQPAAEARVIAREIQRRVGQPQLDREGKDMGPLRYRDIAILLPVAKGAAPAVERELTKAGIPVYSEDSGTGLESPEITQALMHLHLMDNLMDDLALLAALRGPVYQWNEADLARVRLHRPQREASFLEALREAANASLTDGLSLRCRQVLEDFSHERFLLRSMPLDEYLWSYLSRSGMYGYYGAQPGGKLRQANLRMLCTRASEHMANRGGDLHSFLLSVSAGSGVGDRRSPTVLSPWEDVVRIMTIHKSKGLEFPLVFVMGLGRPLQSRSRAGGLAAMHPKLGVALRYVNEKTRTKRETLLGSAIALRARAEDKAERARLLYVALTRARDDLVMVGSSTSLTPEEVQREKGPLSTLGEGFGVWEAKSMLEWIAQTLEKRDDIRVCQREDFSTEALRENPSQTNLSTVPTSFPQKTGHWGVVFHIPQIESTASREAAQEDAPEASKQAALVEKRVGALLEAVRQQPEGSGAPAVPSPGQPQGLLSQPREDPLAPRLNLRHSPLKLGVTALCRSLEEARQEALAAPEEEPESADTKRLPLAAHRPRLLAELPALPAYLRGDEEQTGLMRGIATHKALSLLPLEPLRLLLMPGGSDPSAQAASLASSPTLPSLSALTEAIRGQLARMEEEGILTPQESALAPPELLARFFAAPLGLRALRATEIHREWGFNLRLPNMEDTLLQGVIDLCFLEEGQWVLVDYKTDRVQSPKDLWGLYGPQVDIYRQALATCTGLPVKESVLFAIGLGEGAAG